MRGTFAQPTEVARGLDDAASEVVLPNAIDHHARRERILFARDGFGELETAAALVETRRVAVAKNAEPAAGGNGAEILLVAANANLDILRFVGVTIGVDEGILLGDSVFQLFHLGLEAIEMRPPNRVEEALDSLSIAVIDALGVLDRGP